MTLFGYQEIRTKYAPQNLEFDKYWHIQMHLPEGKGGTQIKLNINASRTRAGYWYWRVE